MRARDRLMKRKELEAAHATPAASVIVSPTAQTTVVYNQSRSYETRETKVGMPNRPPSNKPSHMYDYQQQVKRPPYKFMMTINQERHQSSLLKPVNQQYPSSHQPLPAYGYPEQLNGVNKTSLNLHLPIQNQPVRLKEEQLPPALPSAPPPAIINMPGSPMEQLIVRELNESPKSLYSRLHTLGRMGRQKELEKNLKPVDGLLLGNESSTSINVDYDNNTDNEDDYDDDNDPDVISQVKKLALSDEDVENKIFGHDDDDSLSSAGGFIIRSHSSFSKSSSAQNISNKLTKQSAIEVSTSPAVLANDNSIFSPANLAKIKSIHDESSSSVSDIEPDVNIVKNLLVKSSTSMSQDTGAEDKNQTSTMVTRTQYF